MKLLLSSEKINPLLDEKITLLQELSIKSKDQIETIAKDFEAKIT